MFWPFKKKKQIASPEELFAYDIKSHFKLMTKSASTWLSFYGLNNLETRCGPMNSWTEGQMFKYYCNVQKSKSHHNVPYLDTRFDVTDNGTGLGVRLLFIDQQYQKSDLSEFDDCKIVFYDPKNTKACLTDELREEVKEIIINSLIDIMSIYSPKAKSNKNRINDSSRLLNGFMSDPDFDPEAYFTRKQFLPPKPAFTAEKKEESSRLDIPSIDLSEAKAGIDVQVEKLSTNPTFNDVVQFGFDLKNQIVKREKAITDWKSKKLSVPPAFAMYRSMTASFKLLLEHDLTTAEMAEHLPHYSGGIDTVIDQLPIDMKSLSQAIDDSNIAEEAYDTHYEICDYLCDQFNKVADHLKTHESRPNVKTFDNASVDMIAQDVQLTRHVRKQNKEGFEKLSVSAIEAMCLNMRQIQNGLDNILTMVNSALDAAVLDDKDTAQKIMKRIKHKMDQWDDIVEDHVGDIKAINDGTIKPKLLTYQEIGTNGETSVVAKLVKPMAKAPL